MAGVTKRVGEGSTKQWSKKGWWYYGQINFDAFCGLADAVVARVQRTLEQARAERPATGGVGVEVAENEGKDGVEVKFAEKPEQSVLEQMKTQGFRWSKFQKLWYARRSPETLTFAYGLAGKQAEVPTSPDMNTVLENGESGEQAPDPEETAATVPEGKGFSDRSQDVTCFNEPACAPAQPEGQFKIGGAINNPEYAAGQA
jgi:hypothetical protein